ENGEGGFTSDLSTSMFDFFISFFRSSFAFLTSFFAFFEPLSFLPIVFLLPSQSALRRPPRAISRHQETAYVANRLHERQYGVRQVKKQRSADKANHAAQC